jgi:hypothetical protein
MISRSNGEFTFIMALVPPSNWNTLGSLYIRPAKIRKTRASQVLDLGRNPPVKPSKSNPIATGCSKTSHLQQHQSQAVLSDPD